MGDSLGHVGHHAKGDAVTGDDDLGASELHRPRRRRAFWYRGLDSRTVTVVDSLLVAGVYGAWAATFSPRLGWVALTGLAVSVISVVKPSIATPTATLGLFLILAIIIDQARRSSAAAAAAAKG